MVTVLWSLIPGMLICCSIRMLSPFKVMAPVPLNDVGVPSGAPSPLLRFIVIFVSMTPSKASAGTAARHRATVSARVMGFSLKRVGIVPSPDAGGREKSPSSCQASEPRRVEPVHPLGSGERPERSLGQRPAESLGERG